MSKKTSLALIVIAIIAIGYIGYTYPKVPQAVIGAVSTLDGVDLPFVNINGQREWRGGIPMTATSSVLCSFKNPYAATSTVEYFSAEVTSRGTLVQANNLYISTSTTASATSTNAWNSAFAMGTGQFSYTFQKNVATTTGALADNGAPTNVLEGVNADGSSNYILGPSEYLNFAIGTSTAGTYVTYMTGGCSTVIKKAF